MRKLREMKLLIEKELFTRRALCGLIVQMFLLFLIPLLYLGKYNHAASDCYWFGSRAHWAWLNTHNIFEVIRAAFHVVGQFYTDWQGTFTSIFFFAITPVVFGEQYIMIVPYMMIGMTCMSTFFLFYVLLRKLLHFDGYSYIAISTVTSLMQFEFMYTPASGLYWYNGAVHYVFMQGFVNLTVGFVLLLFSAIAQNRRKAIVADTILASLSGFMASGANFSTTLLNVEFAVLFLIVCIVLWKKSKNKRYFLYLIPFLVSASGFLVNVCAPGNAVRQAHFTKGGVVDTILLCFRYSTTQAGEWLTVFVLIFLLVLLPFMLKATSETHFMFPYPLVVVLGLYCLYASMFAPGFYAFGGQPPISRNQNICKMFLLIAIVLCEIYVVGWLNKRFRLTTHLVPRHGKNVWSWAILTGILAIIFVNSFQRLDVVEKKATFVSYGAYDAIDTGLAALYHHEYLVRLNEYKNNPDKVVYVDPYSVELYPLWVNADTEKSNSDSGELSHLLALWYQKDAIIERKK